MTRIAVLAAIYLLALASTKPADIVAAVVVAAAALAIARRAPAAVGSGGVRPLGLPRFLAATLGSVARGTWEMALAVVGARSTSNAGIVEIPIEPRSQTGAIASALASTLSPGEVLLDIDAERGVYVLHVFDASDPEAIRARHRQGYDRHQRRAIP